MKLIDLSFHAKHGSLSYPGTSVGIMLDRVAFEAPGGTLSRIECLDPHCGTHIDAPLHFMPNGIDAASMELTLPEIVLLSAIPGSIPASVLNDAPELEGKAVLLSTGWERLAGTTAFFDDYPIISPHLAKELATRKVAMVGIDSPSADPAIGDYPTHRILLSAGIPIIEGLVNIRALIPHLEAEGSAYLSAFPLPIQGLEGSPIRAVAIIH